MLGIGGVNAGTAYVDIRPDVTGFTGALTSQVTSATREAERAVGDSAARIGTALSSTGRVLTRALTVPLAAIGIGSLAAAVQFEDTFAGVRKTVDATEPELQALAKAFRSLAKEIPVNVNELNAIGEAAGALGIKKENILAFTRVMADMGVTTDLTSDQAANAFARIANVMQTPQTAFQNMGSTVVALGNAGASTESEIVEMAMRIAGAGKQIGLTEAEVFGFSSALASVGIEAEMGGSAISRTFIDISAAVNKGGKDLDGFAKVAGMSSRDYQKLFKEDAAGATLAFLEGLGRIQTTGGDVFGTLEKLGISEIRQRDALLRAAGAGELFRTQLDLANRSYVENNALTDEAAKRYATTKSQLTLLWNRIKDLAITLGDALLPMLNKLVDAAEPFIEWLGKAVKWFTELEGPVQVFIVVLAGLIAIIGPLLIVLGMLFTALGAIATATGIAILPLLAIIAVIALVVAGVAAAAFFIVKHWDTIKAKTIEIFGNIVNFIKTIPDRIVSFFTTLPERIGYFWGLLIGTAIRLGIDLLNWWAALPGKVIDFFKGLPDRVVGYWRTIKDDAIRIATGISDWWAGLPGKILSVIKDLPGKLLAAAKSAAQGFVKGLMTGLEARSPSLPERVFAAIGQSAKDAVGSVNDAVRGMGVINKMKMGVGGQIGAGGLAATGGFGTANITLQVDGQTLARVVGQPLVDQIRMQTGMRV